MSDADDETETEREPMRTMSVRVPVSHHEAVKELAVQMTAERHDIVQKSEAERDVVEAGLRVLAARYKVNLAKFGIRAEEAPKARKRKRASTPGEEDGRG